MVIKIAKLSSSASRIISDNESKRVKQQVTDGKKEREREREREMVEEKEVNVKFFSMVCRRG